MKKQKISIVKKRLWRVFSDYIRERDKWTCFTCGTKGKGAQIHAGHFMSRVHINTLYDEQNVHAQCYRCNMFLGGNLPFYHQKLVERYGNYVVEDLIKRARTVVKPTLDEYLKLEVWYTMKLKEIKNALHH